MNIFQAVVSEQWSSALLQVAKTTMQHSFRHCSHVLTGKGSSWTNPLNPFLSHLLNVQHAYPVLKCSRRGLLACSSSVVAESSIFKVPTDINGIHSASARQQALSQVATSSSTNFRKRYCNVLLFFFMLHMTTLDPENLAMKMKCLFIICISVTITLSGQKYLF